jgi:hypothetical protein
VQLAGRCVNASAKDVKREAKALINDALDELTCKHYSE